MKLLLLGEMAAKKLCPDCGKSMAGNHYWYKGGWKCKRANLQQPEGEPQPPAQMQPPRPEPAPAPSNQEVEQNPKKQEVEQNPPQASTTGAVDKQPLELTLDIIADAEPFLNGDHQDKQNCSQSWRRSSYCDCAQNLFQGR